MSMQGQMAKGLMRLAKMTGFYPDGQFQALKTRFLNLKPEAQCEKKANKSSLTCCSG